MYSTYTKRIGNLSGVIIVDITLCGIRHYVDFVRGNVGRCSTVISY